MPFVQMENISHFLRACQSPPLNLQSHDIFQTVDLYESKDPAQVLQCIAAFSRKARAVQPSRFSSAIGEKSKSGIVSPQSTGGYSAANPRFGRPRGTSNTSETSSSASHAVSHQSSQAIGGRGSPSRLSEMSSPKSVNGGSSNASSGGVSSWSKRTDEGATTPAWNIHQYGYMGGASQGNQGVTFGGRRQITSPAPKVPSLAEKERKRREQQIEEEQLRLQAEEEKERRRAEREAEEERERLAEEQRWEEKARKQREQERLRAEEEKRRWEDEERKWKEEEEVRAKEEKEAESRIEAERQQKRAGSDTRLQGQFLSQYQIEQNRNPSTEDPERSAERNRVKELERQLEEAKEREAQYEQERQDRIRGDQHRTPIVLERHDAPSRPTEPSHRDRSRSKSRTRSAPLQSHQSSEDASTRDEADYLQREWQTHQNGPPQQPSRPLPTPQSTSTQAPAPVSPLSPSPPPLPPSSLPPRPLPDPATYAPPPRKSPFARPPTSTPSPPPVQRPQPATHPTNPLKKPPFTNPSSLLSREMELDRLRQQEWEQAQKESKTAAATAGGDREGGTGPGEGAWDVNQYGYLGGDGQNKGGVGIGFGGRRQLVGPREPPPKS